MDLLAKVLRFASVVVFTLVGLLLLLFIYIGLTTEGKEVATLALLPETIFLFAAAYILKKNKRRFIPYVGVGFIILYFETLIHRYFFVTNQTFESTDISNIPFFLIPAIAVGLVWKFEKEPQPGIDNSVNASVLASITQTQQPSKGGIKQGWSFFLGSLAFVIKHPPLLIPLIISWVVYASIVLYTHYYWSFPDNFLLGLAEFFVFLLIITYVVCLLNMVMLEIVRQIDEGRPLSFPQAFSKVFSTSAMKVIPLAAFFAIIWLIILVLRCLTSRRGRNKSEPSMKDAAITLAGIGNNPFSWYHLGLYMMEKLLRMTVFLALPAIVWSGQGSVSAFTKAVSIIKQHPIEFVSAYGLTGVAAIIMSIPLIPVSILVESDAVIPDPIWMLVILYVGVTWILGVYLEQMNTAMLYAWHMNWENNGSVGDLTTTPKPKLLGELISEKSPSVAAAPNVAPQQGNTPPSSETV
ncbi:MAG: hypothetical protein AAB531_00110 [Patescibacteria group bacterium]